MKNILLPVRISVCMLAWSLASPGHGEIYRWVDEDGSVHFADRSPRHKPAETLEQNEYKSAAADNQATQQEPGQVIMYATASCPVCQRAREYFASAGISFEEYDLDADEDALLRYNDLKGNGIPLILVGEKRLDGFSESAFDTLYSGD